MDPITMQAIPGSEETLLGILQRLRDLSQQPVVPQNPMAQLGTVLQGFAAGTQGQANPALQMFQRQRQQEVQGLAQQGQIGGTLATLERQRTQREMDWKKLRAGVAGDLMKHLPDNPGAITTALETYQSLGLLGTGMNAAGIKAIAESGAAKTLQERLKLATGAIEAGADPATLGINLPAGALEALRALTPEARTHLFGPDAREKFLKGQEAEVKIKTDRLVFGAKERVGLGTATPADSRTLR